MDLTNAPVYDAAAVARLLGIEYTAEQLAAFGPPPEPVLGFVTHFDPGWSILRLRKAVKRRRVFDAQNWYGRDPFAAVEGDPRYRQVRMEPVPDSTDKTYTEQLALLGTDEGVPSSRVVVAAVTVHFLATGQRRLPHVYVRCADRAVGGGCVEVGNFARGSLVLNYHWHSDHYPTLGLSSSRRS